MLTSRRHFVTQHNINDEFCQVGVEHNCLDCSRPFTTRKAVRNHMVMRPHHEIRFEGEYDAFFDIAMIRKFLFFQKFHDERFNVINSIQKKVELSFFDIAMIRKLR